MKEQKEFILCAAIWYNDGQEHTGQPKNIENGFVVSGRRHHNCYGVVKAILGDDKRKIGDIENSMSEEDYKLHQGFLTSADRYVGREEAWKIAKENGQIFYGLKVSDRDNEQLDKITGEQCKSILISENLY